MFYAFLINYTYFKAARKIKIPYSTRKSSSVVVEHFSLSCNSIFCFPSQMEAHTQSALVLLSAETFISAPKSFKVHIKAPSAAAFSEGINLKTEIYCENYYFHLLFAV